MSKRQNLEQDVRRCHAPEAGMPAFEVGDALSSEESAILARLAKMLYEIDSNVRPEAVLADRTLWELGYDSLALVALRMAVKRAFGAQIQALHWLRLHEELPRVGCFARFLAASGARP